MGPLLTGGRYPPPRHSPCLHHHHLHPSSAQGSPRGSVVSSALRSSPGGKQKFENEMSLNGSSWWHYLGRWWNLKEVEDHRIGLLGDRLDIFQPYSASWLQCDQLPQSCPPSRSQTPLKLPSQNKYLPSFLKWFLVRYSVTKTGRESKTLGPWRQVLGQSL